MRFRGLVILALVGALGWWMYKTRPTVTRLVDGITRPLMGTKAVVKESEYKRVSDAAPSVPEGEQEPSAMIHEGMTKAEVEEILGKPERTEEIREEEGTRVRWTYVAARRVLLFEKGRVVSIEVR
jgi:hypothetical protein